MTPRHARLAPDHVADEVKAPTTRRSAPRVAAASVAARSKDQMRPAQVLPFQALRRRRAPIGGGVIPSLKSAGK